jgi:hypothetical protein
MKNKILKFCLVPSIGIILLNGCGGNPAQALMPNNATQTGAATGALAGSVIGYNTKGNHSGRRALIGGLIGAGVGAGVGNLIDGQNPEPVQTGGWE